MMVDEVKDSTAPAALVADETAKLPDTPAITVADAPVAEAVTSEVAETATPDAAAVTAPARKRKAKPAPAAKAVAKPASAKTKASKPAAPVAAAPEPAVKPATKRPFTAPTRVKQNSAAPKATTAPRKELFAMATTTEMTEKMTAALKDAQEKAKAAFGDAGEFAKGNVEAVVESSKILANGLQEMTKGYVEEAKSAIEAMTADVKELTTVKSPTEFFEKQSALMRKNFDAAVAASSKNSEVMLKLVNEAFQPISTRVSLAMEKIKKAA